MILRFVAAIATLFTFEAVMASPDQVVLEAPHMEDIVRPQGNLPTLADVLTVETRASIFYSYAREVDISARFMKNEGEGVTLFVPTNKAIQALSRKPHEGPNTEQAGISDAEHEAISRSNVHRWVGAHVIPNPHVDFTSSKPYDTLTSNATITFKPVKTQGSSRPVDEAQTSSDSEQFSAVKGPGGDFVDTDAAHFSSIKGPSRHVQTQEHNHPDTDAAHFSGIKGPQGGSLMKPRFGLAAAGRVNTDTAHFASIKGPVSPDRTSHTDTNGQSPIWEQYVLNDGVHIIAMREASNGIMYLIDGTVPV